MLRCQRLARWASFLFLLYLTGVVVASTGTNTDLCLSIGLIGPRRTFGIQASEAIKRSHPSAYDQGKVSHVLDSQDENIGPNYCRMPVGFGRFAFKLA